MTDSNLLRMPFEVLLVIADSGSRLNQTQI